VNHFHAAGGMGYVVRELLDAGLAHGDVLTVARAAWPLMPRNRHAG
jgi:phosphogluconate dehydratase